ncbi:MAG: TraR/DksA family transcriptional regulator [Candidatus Lernaella stagnicola]|nr:TraR/DksA family transcriptional regulator [Candidatus Lernaella stagnicola]
MRKRELEEIKRKLLQDRDRILANAKRTMESITNPNMDDLNDEGDVASSETDQTINLRLRDRESMLLSKIERTLLKFEEDTFGICEECGENISVKRLKARPVAQYCIRCKQEREKIEKGYAD